MSKVKKKKKLADKILKVDITKNRDGYLSCLFWDQEWCCCKVLKNKNCPKKDEDTRPKYCPLLKQNVLVVGREFKS